jgi:hypothetical protein
MQTTTAKVLHGCTATDVCAAEEAYTIRYTNIDILVGYIARTRSQHRSTSAKSQLTVR